MLTLIRPFLLLCLLRLRPQDLPASGLLLAIAMASYVACNVLTLSPILHVGNALLSVVVEVTVLSLLTIAVLYTHGLGVRVAQTLTALVGAGTVITLVAGPFVVWAVDAARSGDERGFEVPILWLLVLWSIVVNAHILRHALSTNYFGGVLVASVVFLILQQITGAMLEFPA